MYKSKKDCTAHFELWEKFLIQQDETFLLASKTVTLATMPEVAYNIFALFMHQLQKLESLVEDKVISVEMFFLDISKMSIDLQSDIASLRKSAIKNDPNLNADQKVSLISENFNFDTLEGSMHKEMASKAMSSLMKRAGGSGFSHKKPT